MTDPAPVLIERVGRTSVVTLYRPEVRNAVDTALAQQLPRKIAMRAILTGEPMTAQEAARWGLVNEVVPADAVLDRALALAERICANAPLAVQASKRLALGIVDGEMPHEADGWRRNQAEIERVGATADAMEGIVGLRAEAGAAVERQMTSHSR